MVIATFRFDKSCTQRKQPMAKKCLLIDIIVEVYVEKYGKVRYIIGQVKIHAAPQVNGEKVTKCAKMASQTDDTMINIQGNIAPT